MSVKLTELLTVYDGRSEFSEWIKKFELVVNLQGIKDLHNFLPLFLKDQAFIVYDALSAAQKGDYAQIKSSLLTAFCVDKFTAFEDFVNRRLKEGEPVDVFLSDLQRLARLVSAAAGEEWVKCAFVAGLPDHVKTQLKAATVLDQMTLNETVERTRAILTVSSVSSAYMARSNGYSQGTNPRSSVRSFSNPQSSVKSSRKCYQCGKPGHIVRNCPDKDRQETCFACNGFGHRASECPTTARQTDQGAKNE